MTTRLATVLLLSTAACLSSTGDDLGLDDLPAYDQDTGGGKFDDANCTDVTYREFIKGYLRGESAADTNPCVQGNDASYRIWAYVAGEQLKPTLDAYRTAIIDRFQGHGSRDAVVAAGTLPADTKAMLAKLDAVKPAHAGKVGVAAWLEYVYKPALTQATGIIGSNNQVDILTHGMDQLTNEVTTFEDEWLGFAERAQPAATEPHAFTLWWDVAGPKLTDLTGPLATTSDARQKAVNEAFLARMKATRPAGAFDEDGATFQDKVTAKMASDYGLSPKPAYYAPLVALRPTGGGKLAYATWAQSFAGIAQKFNTGFSAPSADQKALFQLVIDARPCGSGAEVDTIVQRLTTGLASAGNGPDGTPLAQLSVPTACTAMP